jgi:mono/diheme cytochrome c family protein
MQVQLKSKELWLSLILILVTLLLVSCSKTKSKPELQYMPDMAKGPSVKAQQVKEDPAYTSLRTPVPGTISLDYEPYPFATADTVGPARQLFNPLPQTMSVLQSGRKYYNTYCIVCHGYKGDGKGYIVPKFPAPPSLLTEKIRDWEEGRIFHIITRGRGNMPSYAGQLDSEQRWAIVHYVRALYRAAHPTEEDLRILKEQKLDILFYQDQPDTTGRALWPQR